MSDCYTSNDQNWPYSCVFLPGLTGPYRPVVARVWHGMLLVAATSAKPGPSGSMLAYVYDPYAREYGGKGPLSLFPINLGSAASAPAIWYADLVAWLFYSDGTNLVYQSAPQPGLNPQTNEIEFASFQFGAPSVAVANTQANNPAAILFEGQLYLFWTGPAPGSSFQTVYFVSAPYTPGANLVFTRPAELTVATGTLSEASFALWQGVLYVAYLGPAGTQVVSLVPNATGWQTEAVGTVWQSDCGNLNCSFAPALVADPKGTFLMMVFCKPGSHQLCTTYLVAGNDWSAPQVIPHQLTGISPSVIATGGNYAYLAYVIENNSGTNIGTSDSLPAVYA